MKARWIVAVSLLVIIFIFAIIRWLPNFSIGFGGVVNWPAKKLYEVGSSIKLWTKVSAVKDENEQLRQLISANIVDYVALSRLQNENASLRKELNFVREKKVNIVVASVIGRQMLNRSTLIIDRGSRHGLAAGQVVTVGGGIVIGKLTEVFDQQATVLLLTDSRSQLAVTSASVSGTNGLVIGQTGNSLLLDYVPQTMPLAENDLIVTSGLENYIPAGLLVAQVGKIISKENDVFKQARLIIPVQYDAVENVSIVIGNYAQNTN
jgi:rod shape-determining protein MreC